MVSHIGVSIPSDGFHYLLVYELVDEIRGN